MFRNFFLIALRNFRRQMLFSFLNMFGLALGIASSILIFLYISDELRYDVMHPLIIMTRIVSAVPGLMLMAGLLTILIHPVFG